MLKWLRAKGYPWGKLAIASRKDAPGVEISVVLGQLAIGDADDGTATKEGRDVTVLRWLRNNGCPSVPWGEVEEWLKVNSNK